MCPTSTRPTPQGSVDRLVVLRGLTDRVLGLVLGGVTDRVLSSVSWKTERVLSSVSWKTDRVLSSVSGKTDRVLGWLSGLSSLSGLSRVRMRS